jgi:hypothetical protein
VATILRGAWGKDQQANADLLEGFESGRFDLQRANNGYFIRMPEIILPYPSATFKGTEGRHP